MASFDDVSKDDLKEMLTLMVRSGIFFPISLKEKQQSGKERIERKKLKKAERKEWLIDLIL